ncbi:hypothetical protein DYB34_006750 [Aphanomyces astaci]|uniref:2-amino-4-hydroxy-6-hydroxymethyldihydropteridine diphosphokinase n=1 Tax=Aphanomyces astaci TaxID=112090 RepID=A0A397G082_APHAT|nr:hypothetical protein DYB34_006750 [Aphanomyces astaci]RHZ41428.1 hypothetical protein DYB31_007508 [Aphanomyces astaci]
MDLVHDFTSFAIWSCPPSNPRRNLSGNRASNLHRAVQELNAHAGRVVRTSLLYTTSPQYVTDQPQFLNAVLELSTSLSAVDLLLVLLGTLRYGPRVLDVDILFYGTHIVHAITAVGPLIIPHALLHERDFVLRPLLDLAADFVHPILQKTIRTLHAALPVPTNPPIPVLSLGPHDLLWPLHTKTYVMGIVNATPDSFSGDGVGVDVTAALAAATAMVDQGADMLDIGGESTKPHAPVVSIDDEIARVRTVGSEVDEVSFIPILDDVVPVLRAIRRAFPLLPLSIDTTKARVAAAAIEAGANMVNDVSGATADSNMLATVAAAQVPTYNDVVADVIAELTSSLDAAMAAGIPTWHVVADPGIGFAKGLAENVTLLRHVSKLKAAWAPCPLLVRRRYYGSACSLQTWGYCTLCGKPNPADRGNATAGTCAAAVAGGADVVRVHDVAVCVDVCKVSDAIWRTGV